MHCNLLFAGPPSASKSYVLGTVKKLLIDGTATQLARRTKSSLFYSADQGSRVVIEDETSKRAWAAVDDRGVEDDELELKKEILTSHSASCETCVFEGKPRRAGAGAVLRRNSPNCRPLALLRTKAA